MATTCSQLPNFLATTGISPSIPHDISLDTAAIAQALSTADTPLSTPLLVKDRNWEPRPDVSSLAPDSSHHNDREPARHSNDKKRDSAAILLQAGHPDSQSDSSPPRDRPSTAQPLPREPSNRTVASSLRTPSLHSLRAFSSSSALRRLRKASSGRVLPPPVPSLPPFHGISLDIPTGELEGLHEVPTLQFSPRGSMLITGHSVVDGTEVGEQAPRKEEATHEDDQARQNGEVKEAEDQAEQNGVVKEVTEDDRPKDSAQESLTTAQDAEEPSTPKRLQPGRRKPSVQMLQAAIAGGRILSAEEISFSMRLRSMYDHGDEKAVDWSAPPIPVAIQPATPGPDDMDSPAKSHSEAGDDSSLKVSKQRDTDQRGRTNIPRSQPFLRTPSEVAGGIEDYSDVSGRDVDRYGFIQPSRSISRSSKGSNGKPSTGERPSMQRVASSLLLVSDSPRPKKRSQRRAASSSVRSRLGGASPAKDARSMKSVNSSHSIRSASAGFLDGARLRSRSQKLLDHASDMLTLPPGLEDIAEREDAGRTATAIKRREWKREEKWQKMAIQRSSAGPARASFQPVKTGSNTAPLKGGGMMFTFNASDPVLVNRTWKGIPDRWRATAWHSFLSSSAAKRGGESDEVLLEEYQRLQEENCADDVQIDVDVPRTINMHVMFRKRYRGGQRLLFRVLHAIALKFPDIGYVQGMASLATTLLCYYDEAMAYVMLVRLWELRGLKTLYSHGFEGLLAALAEFDADWLGRGEVARKLEELGISGTAYGTRWYLTLFNMSIPFPAQLRVWDVFMLLGDRDGISSPPTAPGGGGSFAGADLDALHAASAALIDATRDILLDSDFEVAMKTLTSWIPIKDEDLMMRVAKAEWKAKKRRVGGGS